MKRNQEKGWKIISTGHRVERGSGTSTDSAKVLSLGMVKKAEELEKLAKDIKSRAKG